MKLKYYDRAKAQINGRHAGGCKKFNWSDRIKETCSLNNCKCVMLNGVECENYKEGNKCLQKQK